jgi:hypothetical protein
MSSNSIAYMKLGNSLKYVACQTHTKRDSQGWWHTAVITELRRLRQEDQELQASLGYIVSLKPASLHSKTLSQKKRDRQSDLAYIY